MSLPKCIASQRGHMIFLAVILALACAKSFAAFDTDAWVSYVKAPTAAHADAVVKGPKAAFDTKLLERSELRLIEGLHVLEYEVAAGDIHSIQLAFRMAREFPLVTDLSEHLAAVIGRSVRSNPAAYLTAVQLLADGKCIGIYPTGDLFVDRDAAVKLEIESRERALKSVQDGNLKPVRDTCLAKLSKN